MWKIRFCIRFQLKLCTFYFSNFLCCDFKFPCSWRKHYFNIYNYKKKLHRYNKWQNQIRIKQLLISSKSWNTLNGLFCYFWSTFQAVHIDINYIPLILPGESTSVQSVNTQIIRQEETFDFWQVRKNMEVQSYELIRAFLVQKEPPQDFR